MIRIKAVNAQNLLDVCELTTNRDGTTEEHSCCNAISIAEAKYNAEMYPNAIYNNNVLIGFFMVCLAGELGLLVFGQIGLGILSDTERSHELRFFGDVDLINVVRTFCGTGGRKTDRCQAGES